MATPPSPVLHHILDLERQLSEAHSEIAVLKRQLEDRDLRLSTINAASSVPGLVRHALFQVSRRSTKPRALDTFDDATVEPGEPGPERPG